MSLNNNTHSKGIKISPNYFQEDWRKLKLTKNNKEDWSKAIEIFKDRIEGRYFKQIEALDTNCDRTIGLYSGFAIMSIACLLIETIEQFWKGNIQNSRVYPATNKKKNFFSFIFSKNEINNDSYCYYDFFQRSETLKVFFDTPEKASVFYIKIRCGLLHQGQTKGKSLIHIRNSEPTIKWLDENNINEGISINRRKFIIEIRKVYEDYINKIENSDDLNFKNKIFVKKMKYIVEQK